MAEQYEKITELRPFVQVGVKGAPTPVLDLKIHQALQDFLKDTLIWQVLLDDIPIKANEPNYAVVTPQETLPQRIIWGSIQDPGQTGFRPLAFSAVDQLDRLNQGADYSTHFIFVPGAWNWRTETGVPRTITHEFDPGIARVVPIPDTSSDGALIRLQVGVFPALKAKQVPAWIIERYHETIAERAMGKLQEMAGELWTNPVEAQRHQTEYDVRLNRAQADRLKSWTRANLTVEPRYPIGR